MRLRFGGEAYFFLSGGGGGGLLSEFYGIMYMNAGGLDRCMALLWGKIVFFPWYSFHAVIKVEILFAFIWVFARLNSCDFTSLSLSLFLSLQGH